MALAKISGIEIKGIITVIPYDKEDNLLLDAVDIDKRAAIVQHTGIKQRNIAGNHVSVKDLFAKGIEELLGQLQWEKESVDVLICVTQTAEVSIPALANQLHGALNFPQQVLCYDINSGCSGYVYGLHTVASLLKTLVKKNARAVFCCGDISTRLIDKNDQATRPIFSDAVSVTAIENTDTSNEWYFHLETNGKGEKAIFTEKNADNKNVMRLNGIDVFSYSVKMVPQHTEQLLKFAEKDLSYPELFVFHQANKLINDAIVKKLNIEDIKVPSTLYEYGNTASASIPLTLGLNKEKLNKGMVLLCGFGVGFSVASALILIDKRFYFNCVKV